MRYAIFSDVHSNRQAWEATLADIRQTGADVLLCLGDVIGYGPAPGAVLESVYENCSNFVLGNHDAVVAGRFDAGLFNPAARAVIEWTQDQLNAEAVEFFAKMPLRMAADDLLFVHGNAATPGRYNYVETPKDAWRSLDAVDHRLVFVGHSHIPAAYAYDPEDHEIAQLPLADFSTEDAKRYVINVGSVGEPRDGTAEASYCLFDTEEGRLSFRRVNFDVNAFRKELAAASGLTRQPFFLRCLESTEAQLQEEALEADRLDDVEVEEDTDAAQAAKITLRQRKRKHLRFTADAVALQRAATERRAQFAAHARRRPKGRLALLIRIAAAIVLIAAIGGAVTTWVLMQRPTDSRARDIAQKAAHTSAKASPIGPTSSPPQAVPATQDVSQTQTPPPSQSSIAPAPKARPMPGLDSERGRAVLAAMEAAFNKGVAEAKKQKAKAKQPPTSQASGKQTAAKTPPNRAVHSRLDVQTIGNVAELTALDSPKGGSLKNVTWGEEAKRKARLTGQTPRLPSGGEAKWERFSFTFKAAEDCEVRLEFKGNWSKAGDLADGKTLLNKARSYIADVRAKGAELSNADFSSLKEDGKPTGWWLPPGAEMGITEIGSNTVITWYNTPVCQTISVTADTPVTISYLAKYADFKAATK